MPVTTRSQAKAREILDAAALAEKRSKKVLNKLFNNDIKEKMRVFHTISDLTEQATYLTNYMMFLKNNFEKTFRDYPCCYKNIAQMIYNMAYNIEHDTSKHEKIDKVYIKAMVKVSRDLCNFILMLLQEYKFQVIYDYGVNVTFKNQYQYIPSRGIILRID